MAEPIAPRSEPRSVVKIVDEYVPRTVNGNRLAGAYSTVSPGPRGPLPPFTLPPPILLSTPPLLLAAPPPRFSPRSQRSLLLFLPPLPPKESDASHGSDQVSSGGDDASGSGARISKGDRWERGENSGGVAASSKGGAESSIGRGDVYEGSPPPPAGLPGSMPSFLVILTRAL